MASTIRRALRTFPAVVLTGARQTGKTTLLREEFGGSFGYASLEDPDLRSAALEDPRSFLARHASPVILDEIQNAPELLSYIKTAIDADRRPGGWLLTGSRSFPLMEGIAQSLAGRAAVLQLHGLSQEELSRARRLATSEEVLRGSLPEPRLDVDLDLRLWMASYLQTYLERDVRQLAQVGDLVSFEQFTRLCAARTSALLSLAELARDAGVSATTARRWLGVLEASCRFFRLPPWTRSPTKRLVKSPKLFAADTGLAAFLTGHRDAEVVAHGPLRGALFETLVVTEVIRWFRNRGDLPSLAFWRSSDGLEVDLVIELAGRIHGLEIKANATPRPSMAASLTRWKDIMGTQAGRLAVVCDCDERRPLAPGVEALPWRRLAEFCAEL
jgi:hypothetical protein